MTKGLVTATTSPCSRPALFWPIKRVYGYGWIPDIEGHGLTLQQNQQMWSEYFERTRDRFKSGQPVQRSAL